jgi:O-antigen/teichoic acid export membrane protein
MMAGAAVYAVLILAGTKLFGLTGAAAGVAGAEAITLFLMRYEFKKFVRTTLRSAIAPVTASATAMAAVLFILPSMHVLFAIAIGGGVYAAVVFALKGVTADDLSELMGRLA